MTTFWHSPSSHAPSFLSAGFVEREPASQEPTTTDEPDDDNNLSWDEQDDEDEVDLSPVGPKGFLQSMLRGEALHLEQNPVFQVEDVRKIKQDICEIKVSDGSEMLWVRPGTTLANRMFQECKKYSLINVQQITFYKGWILIDVFASSQNEILMSSMINAENLVNVTNNEYSAARKYYPKTRKVMYTDMKEPRSQKSSQDGNQEVSKKASQGSSQGSNQGSRPGSNKRGSRGSSQGASWFPPRQHRVAARV